MPATKKQAPIPALTPALARLAAALLRKASVEFTGHGCNDCDLTKIPGFETRGSRLALHFVIQTAEGEPRYENPEYDYSSARDDSLMDVLADVLDKAAGPAPKKGVVEKAAMQLEAATRKVQKAAGSASAAVAAYEDARARALTASRDLRNELERLELVLAEDPRQHG